VALDFKSTKESFAAITQSDLFDQFEKSLQLLLNANIPFEVRTTYHSELLAKEELCEMIDYLQYNQYTGTYYIQHFRNSVETIGKLPDSRDRLEHQLPENPNLKIKFR
jgi:pyruvate formate lyase activating enzyme